MSDTGSDSDWDQETYIESTCPVANCKIPVDIILKSSDGVRYGAHKTNLQTFSEGFPMAESTKGGNKEDIPVLEESSKVLRLMLRFMHHAPQPDFEDYEFEIVAAFADAAEKYFIFSALGMCKLYMLHKKDRRPVAVFAYACKHDHMDLADKAAPMTVDAKSTHMATRLSTSHLLKWFTYREYWLKLLEDRREFVQPALTLHKGGVAACYLWDPFVAAVKWRSIVACKNVLKFGHEEAKILAQETHRLDDCPHCMKRVARWIQFCQTPISISLKGAPRFSEI